jgi:hypothetical protein
MIEGRKSDLFNIKGQIEDHDDKEIQDIFVSILYSLKLNLV